MLYLIDPKKYVNKSVDQLWDEDRKAFYFWIIGLFVGLLTLFLINLISLVIYAKDRYLIIQNVLDYLSKEETSNFNTAHNYWLNKLFSSVINIAFLVVTIASLIISLVKSFKIKSFASISIWPTLFIFINTVYGFFSLIQLGIFHLNISDEFNFSVANILLFSLNFVYLLVWFLFSRNVSLIRRIFWRSQIIDSSRAFQPSFDEFGNPVFQDTNTTNNEQVNNSVNQQEYKMKQSEMYKRLNALSKKQLDTIAAKLSVSGYESMSKEEIVKLIYSIHSATDANVKEEMVDVAEKSEESDEKTKK